MLKQAMYGAGFWTCTATLRAAVTRPPGAIARADSVWAPAAAEAGCHLTAYGGAVTGLPSGLPSRKNWTAVTLTLSLASAATGMVPDTFWPGAGFTMSAVGRAAAARRGLT